MLIIGKLLNKGNNEGLCKLSITRVHHRWLLSNLQGFPYQIMNRRAELAPNTPIAINFLAVLSLQTFQGLRYIKELVYLDLAKIINLL